MEPAHFLTNSLDHAPPANHQQNHLQTNRTHRRPGGSAPDLDLLGSSPASPTGAGAAAAGATGGGGLSRGGTGGLPPLGFALSPGGMGGFGHTTTSALFAGLDSDESEDEGKPGGWHLVFSSLCVAHTFSCEA